jgi:hypothetical protein
LSAIRRLERVKNLRLVADNRHTGAVRPVLFVIALLAVFVSPAFAQTPGVQIDPDSPTAQEYSIPLERVRRQADPSGDSRAQPPSARVAPLFGEGIEAQSSDVSDSGDGSGSGSGSGSGGDGGGSDRDRDRSDRSDGSVRGERDGSAPIPDAVVAAAQQPGPPAGGIGSTLLVGGVAAFVLVAGGLGGLILRRRSSDGDA